MNIESFTTILNNKNNIIVDERNKNIFTKYLNFTDKFLSRNISTTNQTHKEFQLKEQNSYFLFSNYFLLFFTIFIIIIIFNLL